jgi:signal transduction histidine kinase
VKNIVRNTIRVLRAVIIFRLLLIALGTLAFIVHWPLLSLPVGAGHQVGLLVLLPTLITSLFMLIPGLERSFGRFYLPAALVLTILDFSAQYGAAYLRPGGVGYVLIALPSGQEVSFFWASIEIVLLILLPCMLAGAVYGLRAAILSASLATAVHLATGVAIWFSDRSLAGFVTLLPLRIGILYTFSAITGAMADTWRREHWQLQTANQRLRGYAATAENLAISRERVRLARAMHDTLAHSLSALIVQLEALDTLHETAPGQARTQLAKIRDHARTGLDETRQAIRDLRSAPVEELGLPDAVKRLVTQFGERNGLQTRCTIEGDPFPILPAQANAMYRIAEEALDNVERHASAGKVAVALSYGDGVALCVEDDGKGFDPDGVDPDRYGLVGIYERAALIDGEVTVDTEPGRGTRVTVEIAEPWKE